MTIFQVDSRLSMENQIHKKLVSSSDLAQSFYMWSKWLSLLVGILLTLMWILDGGFSRLGQMIKELLVLAILFLCAVLALGILWRNYPNPNTTRTSKMRANLPEIHFSSG